MNSKRWLCIIFLMGFCVQVMAQDTIVKKDSTNVYEKINKYSKKRKFTKTLHRLIFKSTDKKPSKQSPIAKAQSLAPFEGKIIRNIYIVTHDPFGFSFTDSTETANSWLEKTGNNLHVKSKSFAIRNLLLIKKDKALDTLLMQESERLVRSRNFVRSVRMRGELSEKLSDSVDIFIEVLDSWSLIPKASFSSSKTTLRLKERNILGTGHSFNNSITTRLSDGQNAYDLQYIVPNFKNTYISTSVAYTIDLNNYYSKRFNMERPFYSSFAKWAGGIYLDEQFRQDSLPNAQLVNSNENFKYLTQDLWGGYSFKLFAGNSEKERTTNLITSLRLLHVDYKETPTIEQDSIRYFSNETFYLGSVGVSSRQFIQDDHIFSDGIVEDVPVGTVYAVLGGFQRKNQRDGLYLGARVSHGNYFSWGYLSSNFEYGTFVRNGKAEQTTYSFQANYFTNLIPLGDRWKMRQFVKPQFLIGNNRLATAGDRVTISEHNRFNGLYGNSYQQSNSARIPGFDSDILGTKKYVLSLQTQFYSPWEFLGFRFNPFLNFTGAAIGNEDRSIFKSRFYSSFGVGCIIRNDYLVFSSFQLSLSFYPSIPGQGNNIFKTNSFETEDFGFQNFELGKPAPVWYN